MLCVSSSEPNKITKIPTEACEVFDVSGAGYTTVAVFTLAIVLGFSAIDAMKWANSAAGIVVGKVGTACITLNELKKVTNDKNNSLEYSHLSKIKNINNAAVVVKELKKIKLLVLPMDVLI